MRGPIPTVLVTRNARVWVGPITRNATAMQRTMSLLLGVSHKAACVVQARVGAAAQAVRAAAVLQSRSEEGGGKWGSACTLRPRWVEMSMHVYDQRYPTDSCAMMVRRGPAQCERCAGLGHRVEHETTAAGAPPSSMQQPQTACDAVRFVRMRRVGQCRTAMIRSTAICSCRPSRI